MQHIVLTELSSCSCCDSIEWVEGAPGRVFIEREQPERRQGGSQMGAPLCPAADPEAKARMLALHVPQGHLFAGSFQQKLQEEVCHSETLAKSEFRSSERFRLKPYRPRENRPARGWGAGERLPERREEEPTGQRLRSDKLAIPSMGIQRQWQRFDSHDLTGQRLLLC